MSVMTVVTGRWPEGAAAAPACRDGVTDGPAGRFGLARIEVTCVVAAGSRAAASTNHRAPFFCCPNSTCRSSGNEYSWTDTQNHTYRWNICGTVDQVGWQCFCRVVVQRVASSRKADIRLTVAVATAAEHTRGLLPTRATRCVAVIPAWCLCLYDDEVLDVVLLVVETAAMSRDTLGCHSGKLRLTRRRASAAVAAGSRSGPWPSRLRQRRTRTAIAPVPRIAPHAHPAL